MKQDVFEWDDVVESIVRKAVENRDLDNATQNLKDQAEESIDRDFHQFNFEQILRDRDTVIKSVQQVLSPRLDSFEDMDDRVLSRVDENDFQANYSDNAVDSDDWDLLMDAYNVLKQINSQLTIWAFVAHANSSDVAKAVDIRQMQADQNEAMKMVNENYDKFISAADKIGRQVKTGQKEALKEVFEARDSELDSLRDENQRLKDQVDELRGGGSDLDDAEPLTSSEADLVDVVYENPGKGVDWVSSELGVSKDEVKELESGIRGKGYSFEVG